MRRIVRTPTWTKEDQKAGKLPEVGAKFLYKNEELCCHYVDSNGEVWANNFKGEVVTPLLRDIKPIESPEEKAERLREEWCKKAMPVIFGENIAAINPPSCAYRIFDAIMSGELKMPDVQK